MSDHMFEIKLYKDGNWWNLEIETGDGEELTERPITSVEFHLVMQELQERLEEFMYPSESEA